MDIQFNQTQTNVGLSGVSNDLTASGEIRGIRYGDMAEIVSTNAKGEAVYTRVTITRAPRKPIWSYVKGAWKSFWGGVGHMLDMFFGAIGDFFRAVGNVLNYIGRAIGVALLFLGVLLICMVVAYNFLPPFRAFMDNISVPRASVITPNTPTVVSAPQVDEQAIISRFLKDSGPLFTTIEPHALIDMTRKDHLESRILEYAKPHIFTYVSGLNLYAMDLYFVRYPEKNIHIVSTCSPNGYWLTTGASYKVTKVSYDGNEPWSTIESIDVAQVDCP